MKLTGTRVGVSSRVRVLVSREISEERRIAWSVESGTERIHCLLGALLLGGLEVTNGNSKVVKASEDVATRSAGTRR